MPAIIEALPVKSGKREKLYGSNSPSKLFRDLGIDSPPLGRMSLVYNPPCSTIQREVSPEELEFNIRKSSPLSVKILVIGDKHKGLKHPEFTTNGKRYTLKYARFEDHQTRVVMCTEWGHGSIGTVGSYSIPQVREKLRDLVDPKFVIWTRRTAGQICQRLRGQQALP